MTDAQETLSRLYRRITIQKICRINGVNIDVLRLDQIHPVISGNKLFKLSVFLEKAIHSSQKTIITFGGAYSNHLIAAALVCKLIGLRSIGIVRGERHEINSDTILSCARWGMELQFLKRETFRRLSEDLSGEETIRRFGAGTIVPLGGFGVDGAHGAAQILDYIPGGRYTHLCVAVGTATTLAGLLTGERKEKVIAFPAIKGMDDIPERQKKMKIADVSRLEICPAHHFGGFARYNGELTGFMNHFYDRYNIPLDFVYTAKMMYGVFKLAESGHFAPGSNILTVHTGGLQGNHTLPPGVLNF